MTFASVSQSHIYLLWVPSRGLLHDFEIFVNLRLTFVWSSTVSTTTRNNHHLHSGASARVFPVSASPGCGWPGRDECCPNNVEQIKCGSSVSSPADPLWDTARSIAHTTRHCQHTTPFTMGNIGPIVHPRIKRGLFLHGPFKHGGDQPTFISYRTHIYDTTEYE